MTRFLAGTTLFLLLALSLGAQTTTGTWELSPAQERSARLSIRPPVNTDGSSVWSSKATIPLQYDLLVGYGPMTFSSLCPAGATCTPNTPVYGGTESYLVFTPASLTFDQLEHLSAVYTFAPGTNCHGGALRWSIVFTDQTYIYIYYGKDSISWTDCSSDPSDPTIDQSGQNMIAANFDGNGLPGGDVRYERSDHSPTYYVNWADAQAFGTGKTIAYVALVLDAGWGGSQVIDPLTAVMVNDNTFVPQSGDFTAVCPSDTAYIQVSKQSNGVYSDIVEVSATQQNDVNGQFRIVDCKYMYNLSAKSLPGKGQYKVDVLINGNAAEQTGIGTEFGIK